MNELKQKNNLAVVYCRVSTEEQAKEGLSLDAQQIACSEILLKEGYELLKVIRDEGKSGGSLNRAGIQEVISLASNDEIGAIFTINSDRMNRNTLDFLNLRKLFEDHNVTLRCIYEPLSDGSPTSKTMQTIMASFNELQRLVTADKVKKTMYAKGEAGYYPAIAPIGYLNTINPDPYAERFAKKIITPDPIRAPLMTEMFKMYSTGNFNVHDLTDVLYDKGLRSRKGGKVAPSRIFAMLKDPIYLGEINWGEVRVKKAKHEPLIDENTFKQVQSIFESHNHHACRRRKHTFLLNGFIYCGRCDKRYTAEWHLKKGLSYYHCSNPKGCSKHIQCHSLESKVADKFKDFEFSEDFINKVIEKVKETFFQRREQYSAKKQALINQKTAIENRKRVIQEKLFERIITNNEFTKLNDELKISDIKIDERIFSLESDQDIRINISQEILQFMTDIYGAYMKASINLKRHFLGFFWERFEVTDGVIITSCPAPLFQALLDLEQMSYKNTKKKKTIDTNAISPVIINDFLSSR